MVDRDDTDVETQVFLHEDEDQAPGRLTTRRTTFAVVGPIVAASILAVVLYLSPEGLHPVSPPSPANAANNTLARQPEFVELATGVTEDEHHAELGHEGTLKDVQEKSKDGPRKSATKEIDTGKETEDPKDQTTWLGHLNPVKIYSVLSSEVGSALACLQQKDFKVQPCIAKAVEEHKQRGFVVPLAKYRAPAPLVWSYIVSTLAVLAYGGVVVLMVYGSYRCLTSGGWRLEVFTCIDEESLKGEIILQSLQPLLVSIVALCASLICGKTLFAWAALPLIAIPVVRVAIIDAYWWYKTGGCSCSWEQLAKLHAFAVSKWDALDASSDGLAYVCVVLIEMQDSEGRLSARLAAGWGDALAGRFLPLMSHQYSLSSAILAVLTLSCLTNLLLGLATDASRFVLCEFVGLGAAARCVPKQADDEDRSAFFKTIGRVIFEAAPQLFLQGSAIMLSDTGLLSQPSLAFSIFMSWGTATAKLLKMLAVIARETCATSVVGFVPLLLVLCSLFLVQLSFFRLLIAETCDSHIWNLFTGCVAAPAMTAS